MHEPRVEKRLLPLLDVTVALVGMLILLIGAVGEPNTEAEAELVYLDVAPSGEIFFGELILAETGLGVNDPVMTRLLEQLDQVEAEAVIIRYRLDPDTQPGPISFPLIRHVEQELTQAGHLVRFLDHTDARGDSQ